MTIECQLPSNKLVAFTVSSTRLVPSLIIILTFSTPELVSNEESKSVQAEQ